VRQKYLLHKDKDGVWVGDCKATTLHMQNKSGNNLEGDDEKRELAVGVEHYRNDCAFNQSHVREDFKRGII